MINNNSTENLFVISGDLSSGYSYPPPSAALSFPVSDTMSYAMSGPMTNQLVVDDEKGMEVPAADSAPAPPPASNAPNYAEIESHHSLRSLLTLSFWRHYFNLETGGFFLRFLYALQPHTTNLYKSIIVSVPDFYGPFWLSTTIIFLSLIIGNVISFARYLINLEKGASWFFDFSLLTRTTPIYYVFTFFVPFFLGILTHGLHVFVFKNNAAQTSNTNVAVVEEGRNGSNSQQTQSFVYPTVFRLLFTIICVYGYCLAPLVFMLLLLLIPLYPLQWCVCCCFCFFSMFRSIVNLYPIISLYYPSGWRIVAVLALFLPHAGLCVAVGLLTLAH